MRESMAQLTPRFSTNRVLREYTERYYVPAASAYRERAANNGAMGTQLVGWQHALDRAWGSLRFGESRVESDADHHMFEVEIFPGDVDTDEVRVELYADGEPAPIEMQCVRSQPGACVYRAMVATPRPATDYTARVIPRRPGMATPLEFARILWQR
jgi:starch phosphorylase